MQCGLGCDQAREPEEVPDSGMKSQGRLLAEAEGQEGKGDPSGGKQTQWYLSFRTSLLTNISVYEHRKFYGSMVSLDSEIHAKFAVLGVDFKGLEQINPFCIPFHGDTVPQFSDVSEPERSSGTDFVRKPRYHCIQRLELRQTTEHFVN